ncbi:snare associated Golgi protein-domain-containing protein [Amanita rubescens]|nr:snare associated Golgi protein-domain-containing protein [Amanita rubescens]
MTPRLALEPPAHSRTRASSITLRSGLTLTSLGRRRSTSCLQPKPPPDDLSLPSPVCESPSSPPDPSMVSSFTSQFFHWLYIPKHARVWSTPTSPRSSIDEPVLPLSASAQKTTFGPEVHESTLSNSRFPFQWRHALQPVHGPILMVLLLFLTSTALVLISMSTLPITPAWPRTITDVAQLGRELHGYSQSGLGPLAHVLGVMAISAIWKHAWSIPGSVIWNVLAGALFSPAIATLLLTLLTTIGSVFATMLSAPLAPVLMHFFPKALDMTRAALEGDAETDLQAFGTKGKSSAWVRLSVLRLIGVIPWSGINIACGVCGVAIPDCFLGSFIGSLPWTAVTCQIGDILQTVASTPSPTSQTISSLLTSPELLLKLVFLSFLSLAPILTRNRLRAIISNSAITIAQDEHYSSRWEKVRAWRLNLRSYLTHRPQTQKDLRVLVQEKIALQELPS